MKKYKALRIIAKINIVVGWISIAIGIIAFVVGIWELIPDYFTFDMVMIPFRELAFCILTGIVLIGAGQLIYLLIDIETNTRTAAEKFNSNTPATNADTKE